MYILLRREFANDNMSWRPLAFEPTRAECVWLASTAICQKYDLFCIIPAEGVSNIPEYAEWIGVAIADNHVEEYTFPRKAMTRLNWLMFYEGADSHATLMVLQLDYLPPKLSMQICCDCLRQAYDQEDDFSRQLDTVMRAVLNQKTSKTDLIKLKNSIPPTAWGSICYDLINIRLNPNRDQDAYRSAIDNIITASLIHKGIGAHHDKNVEFSEIVRRRAPLAVVMASRLIALIEKHG